MDENSNLPRYVGIRDQLIRQIETGDYKAGDKLPSENELSLDFNVSRITVRKALDSLLEKDYIYKEQGKGSFVKKPDTYKLKLTTVFEALNKLVKGTFTKVELILDDFELNVDGSYQDVREKLKLDRDDYLYRIKERFLLNHETVFVQETFLNEKFFPKIFRRELLGKDLRKYLFTKFGYDFGNTKYSLNGGYLNDDQKELFNLSTKSADKVSSVIINEEAFEEDEGVFLARGIGIKNIAIYLINKEGVKKMGEPNIALTRIDNRLVHGQVGVTWTKTLGVNLILVANDAAAADPLQQKLMKTTADSSGVGIRFFSLQKTIDVIHKAAASQKIFLVVKTPEDVLTLVEGGVPVKTLNIGNMHFSEGKVQLTKKVYMDDADKAAIKKISEQGIEVFIQDVPGDKKESVSF